jgi:hypothetical protein
MFASAFIASVPVAVTTLLFEPFVIKSDTSTAIVSAATSIPVPAPTFKVTDPDVVTVPPPVKPDPAVTPTEVTVPVFVVNPLSLLNPEILIFALLISFEH